MYGVPAVRGIFVALLPPHGGDTNISIPSADKCHFTVWHAVDLLQREVFMDYAHPDVPDGKLHGAFKGPLHAIVRHTRVLDAFHVPAPPMKRERILSDVKA